MGSSGKAFDEVKAILGKLDRSIDNARTKRLGPDEPEASENTLGEGSELIGRADDSQASGDTPRPSAPVPNQVPARARPASEYGRARPLRGSEPTNPTGQWDKPEKASKPINDDTVIG